MKIGLCDIYPGKLWQIFKFVEQRHHFDLFIIYPFQMLCHRGWDTWKELRVSQSYYHITQQSFWVSVR